MAESLTIPLTSDKREIYRALVPQIKALVDSETNLTANLANVAAALKQAFDHHWIGFYVREGNQLVLGPFQGPVACTRIDVEPVARGVCGTTAAGKKTVIVPDVDKFPGHIACSSLSRSEIVVPLVADGQTQLVLDVDSANLDEFDAADQEGLEAIIDLIRIRHFS